MWKCQKSLADKHNVDLVFVYHAVMRLQHRSNQHQELVPENLISHRMSEIFVGFWRLFLGSIIGSVT